MTQNKAVEQILKIIANSIFATTSKLHSKPRLSLISEAQLICNDTLVADDLKLIRLYTLIEGWTTYLLQFGLDAKLLQNALELRKSCWAIQDTLASNNFLNKYQKEIEKTLLFFAAVDGLISDTTLKSLNVDFAEKPWYTTAANEDVEASVVSSAVPPPMVGMPQADENGNFIPALCADGGFILTRLDMYTEEFVKRAVTCGGGVLNIGCGYGIPERLALILGAKEIICNDSCDEHLTVVKDLIPSYNHSKLKFTSGHFPDEIILSDSSIDLIGIFRVLHFFDPNMIIRAIRKAYDLLTPNGILILSAETPYLGNWQKFIPEYEYRVAQNDPWPGYVINTAAYETAGYSNKLPAKMHFLDIATLTRVLSENGFSIIKCTTFSRENTFPKALLLNGNESVGVVAKKVNF